MKQLKRLLVAFVVAAMMITSMAPAFAAPFTDIEGQAFASSVSKLQGLGVLEGKGDGTFGYNDKLTRSEATVILVKFAGKKDEADLVSADDESAFADVKKDHWAKGYINVASQFGYIAGVGDGNFAPEAEVTYAQFVTMLMNLLGYRPVLQKGTWPANYLAKASNINLVQGVRAGGNNPIIRGDMAKLADNALTAPVLETGDSYDENGNPTYKQYDYKNYPEKSILGSVFEATSLLENALVLSTPLIGGKDYAENEIQVKFDARDGGETKKMKVLSTDVDLNTLYGAQIKGVYISEDDKFLSIEVKNSDKMKKGNIQNVVVDDVYGKVKIDDKEYVVDTDSKLVYNFFDTEITVPQLKVLFDTKAVIKANAVISDDKIKYLDMFQLLGYNTWKASSTASEIYGTAPITVISSVVESIGTSDSLQLNSWNRSGSSIACGANLAGMHLLVRDHIKDAIKNGTKKVVVYKNNKLATLDDINAGDVLTYIADQPPTEADLQNKAECIYIFASDNTVANATIGDITGSGRNIADAVVKINDTEYTINATTARISKIPSTIEGKIESPRLLHSFAAENDPRWVSSGETYEQIQQLIPLYKHSANFVLDANGQIAFIQATVDITITGTSGYGILTNVESGKKANGDACKVVTLINKEGKVVSYNTSDTKLLSNKILETEYNGPIKDTVVEYSINAEGEINFVRETNDPVHEDDMSVYTDAEKDPILSSVLNKFVPRLKQGGNFVLVGGVFQVPATPDDFVTAAQHGQKITIDKDDKKVNYRAAQQNNLDTSPWGGPSYSYNVAYETDLIIRDSYSNDDTIIFNRIGENDWQVLKWADLAASTYGSGTELPEGSMVIPDSDGVFVRYIFINSSAELQSTANGAFVMGSGIDAKGAYVTLLIDGKKQNFTVSDGVYTAVLMGNKYAYVKYTKVGNNKVDLFMNGDEYKKNDNRDGFYGLVDNVYANEKVLVIGGTVMKVAEDCDVYYGMINTAEKEENPEPKVISLQNVVKKSYIFYEKNTDGEISMILVIGSAESDLRTTANPNT